MNLSGIKYFDYLAALASFLFVAFLIFGGFIFSQGTIGFFHDWFLAPFEEMNQAWAKSGPYAWDPQIGYKFYYTDWIFRLILGIFPSSLLSGEVLSKGLLLIVITSSGFGAFCLGKRLKLGPYVSFGVGLMYIFSPIIFTRIVAGHIYYLIAYSLSPLILASFLKGVEENRNKYFIIAGLLLSLAVIQIQFLVIILVILLVFSLVDLRRIKKSAVGLLIIFSVAILITLSPLLLAQLFTAKIETPVNITQLLSYRALTTASDLAKSFRILGYEVQPYSYERLDETVPPWVFYLDFLLPVIGFSVLFFRRDKYTISFALISIIGLYLMKGTHAPFAGIFIFLFTHGLYIFRELWHIAILYSLSITFLSAFFIHRLIKLSSPKPIKISLSLALISIIVISNGYPLLLGNFAGFLQKYNFPEQYHTLYNKLLSNPEYNVLILPYINPIRYDSLKLQGLDPLITDTPSMIFPTLLPNSESSTLGASTWLLSSILENRTHNLGMVLTGFGIKYIILRNDFVSNYPELAASSSLSGLGEKWYNSIEPILDSQKDLKMISNTSQYRIYENLDNASKIFAPQFSAGGLSNFDSLVWISNLTSLSNVAFYPSVSNNYSINFVDSNQERNMSSSDFVDLGNYSVTFDAKQGWTSNRIAFGNDHLLSSRVRDGIFSMSDGSKVSLQLPSKYNNRSIEMWVKALVWNQGGLTKIGISGKDYPLTLMSSYSGFRIFKVFEGVLRPPYNIFIKNIHGNNYLEGLYIKDQSFENASPDNKTLLNNITYQRGSNLVANPSFSGGINSSGLPLQWDGKVNTCRHIFNCKIEDTVGWDDNSSLRISTRSPHNQNTTSSIFGHQIDVKPKERYEIVTHMKLSRYATLSHLTLKGFNETSSNWQELIECPTGTNGPLEWITRICQITIPSNVTKIAPVLDAGWSSGRDKVARTWFDAISISKITDEGKSSNIGQFNQINLPMPDNKSSSTKILEYNKVNPTLWNLHISASRPATVAFAEPFDQRWEATVYKGGNKVDTVKSTPLYGSINSFQIKQTGNLDIVLNFAPQYWYYIGFIISGITFVTCIFYLIYDWITNRTKKPLSSSVSNVD